MDNIRKLTDELELSAGDLIVDELTGYVGILICRERRIDMFDDDIYFWEIKWVKNLDREADPTNAPTANIIEEEGLKLSILVEMVSLYPAGKNEHNF
jgi:hypothetical protein